MTPMSRFYADEPTREREVAMYVDGVYMARGKASETRSPASYGFKGWETIPPTGSPSSVTGGRFSMTARTCVGAAVNGSRPPRFSRGCAKPREVHVACTSCPHGVYVPCTSRAHHVYVRCTRLAR